MSITPPPKAARVHLIDGDQAPLLAKPFFADGDPGPIVAALAQVPELLCVAVPFIGMALGASAIDVRTKEIVILRTSAVMACRYCVDSHTVVALDNGLTEAEVRHLREAPVGEGRLERHDEQALLDWIDEVASGRGPVRPKTGDAMAAAFRDHEVIELTVVIGATLMLNRFCTALQLPTSPDVVRRLAAEGFA